MGKGHFPLVLGGDHSISGRHRLGDRRVLPGAAKTRPSLDRRPRRRRHAGNLAFRQHPRDARRLAPGRGAPEYITGIGGTQPKVNARNVALVGIRSWTKSKRCGFKRHGVQVHAMSDIDRNGIHRIMKKALTRVTDGFGLRARELRPGRGGSNGGARRRDAGQGRARLSPRPTWSWSCSTIPA